MSIMAHLQRRAADGHLVRNAAGHLAKNITFPCQYCSDNIMPTSIVATFSGIVVCTTCFQCAHDGKYYKVIDSVNMNGVFTVPGVSECGFVHTGTLPSTLKVGSYLFSSDCSVLNTADDFDNYTITIELVANGDLEIAYYIDSPPADSPVFDKIASYGTAPSCDSVWESSHNNSLTGCCQAGGVVDDGFSLGYDGSVSLVPSYC